MPPAEPRLEDLPDAFPAFPLAGALLLPRSRLPLNIFEPRYLAMIEDAMATGRLLAMIQPDPQQPEGPAGPALCRVGCLGRLSSFSETEDGRFLITLTGLIRFSVAAELEGHRGYRRLRGDFTAFAADLAPPADTALNRPALLAALRAYFTHRQLNANWEAIEKLPDHDLVLTLAVACPFDPPEKQALLEAPGPAERARTLQALLEIGSHGPPPDDAADASDHSRAS